MLSGMGRMGHPVVLGPWLGVCWQLGTELTLGCGTFGLQAGVCFLDVGDDTEFLLSKFLLLFLFYLLKFHSTYIRNRINCT